MNKAGWRSKNRITYGSKTSSEEWKVIADAWENEGVQNHLYICLESLEGMGSGVYSNDLSFSGRKDTFPASDGTLFNYIII